MLPEARYEPGKGNYYVFSTPEGNYNLRDFAGSSDNLGPHWTIDIPKSVAGINRKPEIKFLSE